VGAGKAVTLTGLALTGSRAGNYELNVVSGLTGTIQPLSVTISGMTVADKVYDTNRNAIVSGGTISGVLSGDTVQVDVSGATFLFNSKDVGTGKAVAGSGVALGGSSAVNYTLSAQPSLPTASITAAPLTISGVAIANKVYVQSRQLRVESTKRLDSGYHSTESDGDRSGGGQQRL